jgi:hypothetical protein
MNRSQPRVNLWCASGIRTVMDVRVLVCWHPGDIFHASVASRDFSMGWSKLYPSKRACADDLCQIGLITIMDRQDVLESNFDIEDRILTTDTDTVPELLQNAGFVEFTPSKLN